ncbi:hypothetical protein PU629_02555 [Pullulanibacillus sp. KACC 23026]|uniref:hypothetical protein n=1 Tax=Pullulanibacillus sp. KACC 23026 TaxID=3028315 RepID=UPI0023AF67FB|nr:hypothetical protein [Pullulanibacillus sp. KACC 23026]WEG13266.1 hypothetical protein PU629_02555 [Pullulanibacillus sp. KACC 23026]
MILSIFLYILLILGTLFFSKARRISALEIISLWFLVWIINHTISSIITVNLEYYHVSQKLSLFWTHALKRLFLYPLIIIWSFNLILAYTSKIVIAIHLLVTVLVLILIEYIFIWIGVLQNRHWNVFYSFLEWSFCVVIAFVFWKWFRHQLTKGY